MSLDLQDWVALGPRARGARRRESLARARDEARSHHAWIAVGQDDDPQPEGGTDAGELAGVPFAVKDNIDVAGFTTTAGSPLLSDQHAILDADVVGLLREAGGMVAGKTNLHELAFGGTSNNATYGPVRNPFDTDRVAGGSSGGSAVAVALGSTPFALGTDTGGSVTVPSSFCGIPGFRPSTGRYPGAGVVNLSTTRDTIGIHARTVRDVRAVDRVITRSRDDEPVPALEELVLGRIPSRFHDVEREVAQVLDAAEQTLRRNGVRIVDVEVPDDLATASGAGLDIVFFEAMRLLPARVALGADRHPDLMSLIPRLSSPDVRRVVQGIVSANPSLETYDRARRRRWELRRQYEEAFAASGADAFFGPTSAVLPPRIGDDDVITVDGVGRPTFETIIRNAGPGSVAGVPMLSLPAGFSSTGLPVGLCLEGAPFGDRRLLAVAESLEAVLA
ncbi:amidase family protein [Janibacter sp. GS2]|uniref:amidase family protein n=1 Tax=Janibacter sp. GS2 TaxID=3442646 RepID=UPI003EB8016D